MDNIFCFIIENGINTSYINSLIVALFLKKTNTEKMIYEDTHDTTDVSIYYIQEMIKSKFIDNIRNNRSIELKTVNEIRNLCYFCGWKEKFDLLSLFNVNDFYIFLIKQMDIHHYNCCHFMLEPEEITIETSITELAQCINFSKVEEDDYISFYINRKNNRKIDIMKAFKVGKKRYINSIVCFSDRYYALIKIDNQWYYFDDTYIPSIRPININLIRDKIKQECILVFYSN